MNKKAYRTYMLGKEAMLSAIMPLGKSAIGKKMKKLTVKQQLKEAIASRDEALANNARLITQLQDQNRLLDRARTEGNQLIDTYNKLAGKFNAIRSLVTNND